MSQKLLNTFIVVNVKCLHLLNNTDPIKSLNNKMFKKKNFSFVIFS